MTVEGGGVDFYSLGTGNISSRLLPPPVSGNESVVHEIGQSKIAASFVCDAAPVYCSVKWLAVTIVLEIAFGTGKRNIMYIQA